MANPKASKANTEEVYQIDGTVKPVEKKERITFKSLHRGTIVFMDHKTYIKFVNHLYSTDNPKEIEFLRNCKVFNTEIFEGEFPEWVKEKIKKDKEFISFYNPDEEKELTTG